MSFQTYYTYFFFSGRWANKWHVSAPWEIKFLSILWNQWINSKAINIRRIRLSVTCLESRSGQIRFSFSLHSGPVITSDNCGLIFSLKSNSTIKLISQTGLEAWFSHWRSPRASNIVLQRDRIWENEREAESEWEQAAAWIQLLVVGSADCFTAVPEMATLFRLSVIRSKICRMNYKSVHFFSSYDSITALEVLLLAMSKLRHNSHSHIPEQSKIYY